MKYLLICFLLLSLQPARAQDSTTYYFNQYWRDTSADQARYFRKMFAAEGHFGVRDYYINGTLQMTGAYLDEAAKIRDGAFCYYDENGYRESEGRYQAGLREGVWTNYYEGGSVRSLALYKSDKIIGLWQNWYENGAIRARGHYRKGKARGTWRWYYEHGIVASREIYRKGRLKRVVFYDSSGKRMPGVPQMELLPRFPGGDSAMYQYLQATIQYPQRAVEKGWEGTVKVRFLISRKGAVERVKVLQGVYPLLDEEARRVISAMPQWQPGRSHNLPVDLYFMLPVRFELQ